MNGMVVRFPLLHLFRGNPITVFSLPLGLPLLRITGGNVTAVRSVMLISIITDYSKTHVNICMKCAGHGLRTYK